MKVSVESRHLNGLVVLSIGVFRDERGFFMETYHRDDFAAAGVDVTFVQDNHSRSARNVVRGLHFQWEPPMGKLMRVTQGSAYLVAVDIRKGSPTLGKWYGREVNTENNLQIYAPAGFARGFAVLSEIAEIQYKCTGVYNKQCESGIRWDDPDIGIEWPVKSPILSEKDRNAQTLRQWLSGKNADNFSYTARVA